MKQKIIRIISSILCVFVLLGNISVAHGTQDIDITEKLSYTEFERIEGSNYSMSRTKTQSKKSGVIMTPLLIVFVHETPDFFGKIKTVAFVGTEVDIIEELYWFYLVEVNGAEGYIFRMWLSKDKEEKPEEPAEKPEIPEQVNAEFNITYDHVYVNKTNVSGTTGKPRAKLLYTGSGEVVYSASNTKIISVDSKTGLITGKKPGMAYLIASVDGTEKDRIPVYCIYQWEQGWTGKANKSTNIYTGTSDSTPSLGTLSSGAKFYVKGDDGDSAGWAYGCTTADEKGDWGFVKINDISTKGTVSQYNSLGWTYPIENTKFKKISSVYGWRSGNKHLGLDINKGTYTTILGEKLVAPFNGKVVFANASYNYTTEKPNYGFSVVIESEKPDPISGNKLRVVYMHMNSKSYVDVGKSVDAGQQVGEIGTTGDSTGPHLHLEINNKGTNFAGTANEDSFDKTINPIFFYLNSGMTDGADSTNNEYWYNDNK